MKKHFIDIPPYVSEYIEKLYYEKKSYEDILSKILIDKISCPNNFFKEYHHNYTLVSMEYQAAYTQLTHMYIDKKFNDHQASWALDFSTHMITITQFCNCEVL